MKLFKLLTLALAASIAGSALGWNYTVHNNTPYHMIVSFDRIGLFDKPVTLTPQSSITVNSNEKVGLLPVDYCYAGAHLLLQPLPDQQIPQVMVDGKPAQITKGRMPSDDALQQLSKQIEEAAKKYSATLGMIGGGVEAGIGITVGAFAGGGMGILGLWGLAAGAIEGSAAGTIIGSAEGLIGGLVSISKNEVQYIAPYLPIAPKFDACWHRTITLNYDAAANQINTKVE
jgi:hypothetical protein